jgi:hypothetical protein
MVMSSQIVVQIEKRRGRPKGITSGISKKQHLPNEAANNISTQDPYKDCICDLSDLTLSATGHLDSCIRPVISNAATVNPGTRPVIINLEDDSDDGTGRDTLPSALMRHGKFLQETDPKFFNGIDLSVSRPANGGRERPISPYNRNSIARDILRAAGIHPTLPPLNWHLLQKK